MIPLFTLSSLTPEKPEGSEEHDGGLVQPPITLYKGVLLFERVYGWATPLMYISGAPLAVVVTAT